MSAAPQAPSVGPPLLLALLSWVALTIPAEARAEQGAALVQRFQCARCHEVPGVPLPPRDASCVQCHVAILDGSFEAPAEALARWQKNIVHLTVTPSLLGLGARVRPEWLVGFLSEPQDLRPRMEATMPRMALTPDEARTLAKWLTRDAPAFKPEPPGDAARGRALLGSLGCVGCHLFSGAPQAPGLTGPIPAPPGGDMARALKLAPDLRHTRARFRPEALTAWLRDPASLKADTLMPAVPMSAQDARDLAAWLMTAPLEGQAPRAIPARLPVLEREVRWEEVERRVFKKICWHCHADADLAGGDGGPGNTGGFGFPGRSVQLDSPWAVARGGINAQGDRQSLLRPLPGGRDPWVLAALLARQREEVGDPVPGVRGMPLGLPSLPPEDIQLVESWIAQGARR